MIETRLNLVTAPAATAISLAECKAHSYISTTDDDAYVTALVSAVTAVLDGPDGILGRALITQTWDMYMDSLPAEYINVPLPPLQSVTSIKYLDVNGDQQTLASDQYSVNIYGSQGQIVPAYGVSWPSGRDDTNGVVVRFVCGYTTVPTNITLAMKMLVAHYYENRELTSMSKDSVLLPMGFNALIGSYRVRETGSAK